MPNGCWEWTGCKDEKGYGFFRLAGKNPRAHRASWSLFQGPIPPHLHVLHECDNPSCVNPGHLFLGTNADNVKDKVNKGRQAKGVSNGQSHLTEDTVRAIKQNTTASFRALGRLYKVSHKTISSIHNGATWRHIEA